MTEKICVASVRLAENESIFKLQLNFLAAGSATTSPPDELARLLSVEDEATELIKTIVANLKAGSLTPTMTALIATYLENLTGIDRFALLGLKESRRPRTSLGQKTSAMLAFTESMADGMSEELALINAYNAFFRTGPLPSGELVHRTYEDDKNTPQKGRDKTIADRTMRSVIRPLLAALNLLKRRGPGRKRIVK